MIATIGLFYLAGFITILLTMPFVGKDTLKLCEKLVDYFSFSVAAICVAALWPLLAIRWIQWLILLIRMKILLRKYLKNLNNEQNSRN